MLLCHRNESKTLNVKYSGSEPVFSQTKNTVGEAQQLHQEKTRFKQVQITKTLVRHNKVMDSAILTILHLGQLRNIFPRTD